MALLNAEFQWQCQPEAEKLLLSFLKEAVEANVAIKELKDRLLIETSTRLFDWIDHIAAPFSNDLEENLLKTGFTRENAAAGYTVFSHKGAQLPRFVLKNENNASLDIAVKVDLISDFLNVRGIKSTIEGTAFSSYRKAVVKNENNCSLFVVERRGTLSIEPSIESPEFLKKYFDSKEKWKTRARSSADEDFAMQEAIKVAEEIVHLIGKNQAAALILECEREFWQAKNTAGQIQKNRQDRLGMGWANHDHHTFRSSRKRFHHLVRLFEILGFYCRERYYAGQEAGWGAQVMENEQAKLILFLDVDLSAEEIEIDFAHHPIHEIDKLGTIGLWCELHGDSILSAGMHHLEAQFMFDDLTKDLSHSGIRMMDPFSSFPYLKQAFTAGEVWKVNPRRIQSLVENDKITEEQALKFRSYGAIGSHMENLQRREGYKGFNQKNVSVIITKTNPLNMNDD
jgi:hypothetical protein